MRLSWILLCMFVFCVNLPCFALADQVESRWEHEKPYDVFGIGAATFDSYYMIGDEEFRRMLGIPFSVQRGEMLGIDRQTFDELYKKMDPVVELPSDSAANAVTNLALFGAKVSYNAIVSDDEYGKKFINTLKKAGVINQVKYRHTKNGTSRSLIYITPDGERTILTHIGAHEDMSQEDINYHDIRDFKVVFVEAAIWDKSGKLSKAALRAFKIAQKVGAKRAFSLHDVYFINKHRSEFQEFLKHTDIVFGNEYEARALYNTNDLNLVIKKLQKAVDIAVITQASKGALIITPERVIKINRADVSEGDVKDTSGAGDAFAAGFLYGYISDYSLEKCGEIAAQAAREVIKNIGPQPERPFKEVLKDLL